MNDRNREDQHAERNQMHKDMRQQEQQDLDQRKQGGSTDHHGLAGQRGQESMDQGSEARRQQGRSQNPDEDGRQFDQSGFSEGGQFSDGSPQMGWSQNADDIGRQYDQSGFAQGGQDGPQQQGWSGETRGDRQQFQSEYDEQIQDDGSMRREQKLQQGWQDPDDPSQIADEGLVDEDEEDRQGGRI